MIRRLMHHVVDGYDDDPRDPRARRRDRAVVRAGRQPGRLRLDVRARPAAVAQEPARQQRRRPDRRRRRRRPQPQLPDQVGLRQRGLLARPVERDLPRRRRRRPSPRRRRSTRSSAASASTFFVNYHSAAELLLYGTGWQVATPTPDDVIYEAMAGDDAEPGRPGLRPGHLGRALHDQRRHRHAHDRALRHARLHAGDVDLRGGVRRPTPTTSGRPRTAAAGSSSPTTRRSCRPSSRRTSRSRSSVAESADDPDDPASVVGREAEDFRVDTFDVSYGDPQTVAVVAKRALRRRPAALPHRRRPRPDRVGVGVARRRALRRRERRLLRRVPRRACAAPIRGDRVRVWFSGASPAKGARRASERVHLHGRERQRRRRARARQRGLHRRQPDLPARHQRAEVRRRARGGDRGRRLRRRRLGRRRARASRTTSACSSHYDAVLWYLGDNRITQDPEDELI